MLLPYKLGAVTSVLSSLPQFRRPLLNEHPKRKSALAMLGVFLDHPSVLLVFTALHHLMLCQAQDYPSPLLHARIPLASPRAPRLASFCTQLSPNLVKFCSHVTYPVFSASLVSDSEWQVALPPPLPALS